VLGNSQTLVLGGLIQNKRTLAKTGIPFLNRIPIFGYLFGSTQEKTEKTELLILITPRVVGTAVEAARITDEKRRVTPEFREIMRRYPRSPFWQQR
jgi:general secretion pathway protein D